MTTTVRLTRGDQGACWVISWEANTAYLYVFVDINVVFVRAQNRKKKGTNAC